MRQIRAHRVQVGRIRRQVFDDAVAVADAVNEGSVFVGGEVVENDNAFYVWVAALGSNNGELCDPQSL